MKTAIQSRHNTVNNAHIIRFQYESGAFGVIVINERTVYFKSLNKRGTTTLDNLANVFNAMLSESQPYHAESTDVPNLAPYLKPCTMLYKAMFNDGILECNNVRISRSEVEVNGVRRPIDNPMETSIRLLTGITL